MVLDPLRSNIGFSDTLASHSKGHKNGKDIRCGISYTMSEAQLRLITKRWEE